MVKNEGPGASLPEAQVPGDTQPRSRKAEESAFGWSEGGPFCRKCN